MAGSQLLHEWQFLLLNKKTMIKLKQVREQLQSREVARAPVVVVPVHTRDLDAVATVVPLARDRGLVGGKAAAYLCTERACELPVTEAAALAALLERP